MQRQVNSDMWLVVHTPKTAGTSFREALEKHFGKSRIVRDYGPKAGETSDVVREHLYSGDELEPGFDACVGHGVSAAETSGARRVFCSSSW